MNVHAQQNHTSQTASDLLLWSHNFLSQNLRIITCNLSCHASDICRNAFCIRTIAALSLHFPSNAKIAKPRRVRVNTFPWFSCCYKPKKVWSFRESRECAGSTKHEGWFWAKKLARTPVGEGVKTSSNNPAGNCWSMSWPTLCHSVSRKGTSFVWFPEPKSSSRSSSRNSAMLS